MAKLIITLDGQLLSEFELDKERITIGRKPHNDIPIDNLAISGEHAAITTFHNDTFRRRSGQHQWHPGEQPADHEARTAPRR